MPDLVRIRLMATVTILLSKRHQQERPLLTGRADSTVMIVVTKTTIINNKISFLILTSGVPLLGQKKAAF